MMRRFASIVCLLLLLTAASPAMVCATGRPMRGAETSCCEAMHGKCGAMAKTGCCRTDIRTTSPQAAAQSPAVGIQWINAIHSVPALRATTATEPTRISISASKHPPPEGPPPCNSILRI